MPREVTTSEFLQYLHDALTHLHELPFQSTHPLGEALNPSAPLTSVALHRLLLAAFELLRPPRHVDLSAARWRHFRYLQFRYVDGVPVDRVGLALGVGDRQARREHRAALQELGTVLGQLASQPSPADPVNLLPDDHAPEQGTVREQRGARQGSEASTLEVELSTLEAGPGPELLDLAPAIEDAIRLVRRLAEDRRIEIVFAPVHGQPRVVVTRTVLRQILLMILNHLLDQVSIRHVAIAVSADLGPSQVQVMLTGDQLGTVSRVGPAADSPGLLTARRLAESQDGALRVEQRGDGRIALHLSLVTDRATLAVIIDDNPDVVRLFRRFLRGQGFRLLPVRAGRDALEVVRATQPDVVTLDLMMPVQDGWDLLDALRREPATARIPIVACSILPERDLALALGATAFLAKPVSPETLLAVLAPFRRRLSQATVSSGGPARPGPP